MTNKKKVVLLVNIAPEVIGQLTNIYNEFKNDGYDITLVGASHLPEYLYELPIPLDYNFFEYFKKNYTNRNLQLPNQYKGLNIWEQWYPDYDRAEFYGELMNDNLYYERLMICLYNYFDEIFEKEQPQYLLYENVSNTFAYTAYTVAKQKGINYLGLIYSRIPNRMEPDKGVGIAAIDFGNYMQIAIPADDNLYSETEKSYIEEYLKGFFNIVPDYMAVNNLSPDVSIQSQFLKSSKISYFLKLIKLDLGRSNEEAKYDFQFFSGIKRSVVNFNRKFLRKFKLKHIYAMYSEVDKNEAYFMYPLQYHPESSTSVAAKHYVDEFNTIRNISFNIPFGCKLYVKDHPGAIGFPTLEFYRALTKLPNVKLIPAEYNTKNLIRDSLAVVTITSTVGFESIILNKPVVLLGNVFYENHPLVYKMRSYDDLFDLLKQAMNNKNFVDPKKTVWAYYQITIPNLKNYGKMMLKYLQSKNV